MMGVRFLRKVQLEDPVLIASRPGIGSIGLSARTTPRQLFAIAGSEKMREGLSQYDLVQDIDYETPANEGPTLSSFLLWIAQSRGFADEGSL